VEAARRALADWRQVEDEARAEIVRQAARLLRERAVELGRLEALDAGKPVGQAIDQVTATADAFDYWARLSLELRGAVVPAGRRSLNYTLREPVGVVGVVTPWNYPMLAYAESIPGALALGNTVVLKPAQLTPLTALALAEVFAEAGLPAGALNVVTGAGSVAGEALIRAEGVDMLVFTGSTGVGRRVGAAAGEGLKRVVLELGGKSPNLIFADADLDLAIGASLFSFTVNQGQLCTAGTRLLVERSIHDEVVDRLNALARTLPVGDPFEPDTKLGALISEGQVERVDGYVQGALGEGATLVTGGERPRIEGPCADGAFYTPTILTSVDREMTIAREEVFGPVLAVLPFDGDHQAAELANDTTYGLNAAVWTNDITRAHLLAERIEAGTVYVNTINGGAVAPHDRYKGSGLGITGGREQLEAMTRVKSVYVNLGGAPPRL
jgi:aldehyde dehydrogenase (NAD+)/phenylacetaldehyde dehydrogenase